MEEIMNKKSNIYNILKVICTLLVVLGHVFRMYTEGSPFIVQDSSRILEMLTKFIYTFHMPCFMMISGCVFGYCIEKGKYKNKKEFVKNKTKRILVPYITFGILYVAPIMIILNITESNYFQYVIMDILEGFDCRHLWFLLALFWIFCVTILFSKYILKIKWYIFMLISFGILLISSKVDPIFQLQNTLYYQFFFYLGIVINQKFDIIYNVLKKAKYLIFIFPILILTKAIFPSYVILNVLYAIIGIVWLLQITIIISEKNLSKQKLYNIIQNHSFGIYLFHPMIIYLIYYLFQTLNINAYILSLFAIVVSIALSILFIKIIRKFKLKFLIGET